MHLHAAAKCRRHSAYYACGSKMPSALCMRQQNAVGTLHAAAKCRRHIMILPCMPSAYYDSALHACHHTYKSYSIRLRRPAQHIYGVTALWPFWNGGLPQFSSTGNSRRFWPFWNGGLPQFSSMELTASLSQGTNIVSALKFNS
jgi:hypothetical protein